MVWRFIHQLFLRAGVKEEIMRVASGVGRRVKGLWSRAGFTLLELIIVLVVLAALAAMVIPTLGWVKDQADAATTAAGAQELLNNLEIYKGATGRYPQRLDTMIDETGALNADMYGSASSYGSVVAGGGSAYYYMTNGAGITQVTQHISSQSSATGGDPNTATTVVALDGSTPLFVMAAGTVADTTYTDKTALIIQAAFPNQTNPTTSVVPDGHTLVFLGVGSKNSAAGSTMTGAPLAPEKAGSDPNDYDRYIAVFDVQAGGSNARGQMQLRAVLDPEFNVVARNLKFYKNSGPQDDEGNYVAPSP